MNAHQERRHGEICVGVELWREARPNLLWILDP